MVTGPFHFDPYFNTMFRELSETPLSSETDVEPDDAG